MPEASRLLHDTPWWRNLFENTLTVQFNHRMTAYAAARARARRIASTWRGRAPRALPLAAALAGAIVLQAALGIVTLLQQVPIGLALAHQAGAVIVLALATAAAQRDLGEQKFCADRRIGAGAVMFRSPFFAQDRRAAVNSAYGRTLSQADS